MRFFFAVVGLAMFVGGLALRSAVVREAAAFPAEPAMMTVAQAMAIEQPGEAAWVELTDVRFPCDQATASASTLAHRLGFGASDDERIIITDDVPCSDAPTRLSGVLTTAPAGSTADLEFPGYDFARWPRPWQSMLHPAEHPNDPSVAIIIPFSLMGLVICGFYLRPRPAPRTQVAQLEGTVEDTPWRSEERVLPDGPLPFINSLFDRAFTLFALLVMSALMFGVAWTSLDEAGVLRVAGALVGFGVGGFLLFLVVKLPFAWKRDAKLGTARTEAAAEVLSRSDTALVFKHPLTAAPIESVVVAHESPPLVHEDFCLVVWGERPEALVLVREGFEPFDLSPSEQRAALRRFVRYVRSKRL